MLLNFYDFSVKYHKLLALNIYFKSRRFFQPNIVNLIYEGQMFQNYVDLYSNNVNIWPNKQLTDKIQVAKKIWSRTLWAHIQEDSDEEEDEGLAGKESDAEDEEMEDQSLNEDDCDVFEEDEKPERRFGEPRPTWKTGHNVPENKTVFVRNLNFESDQDDLQDLMEEHFGKLLFAVLVIDKVTERPKVTFLLNCVLNYQVIELIQATFSEGENVSNSLCSMI